MVRRFLVRRKGYTRRAHERRPYVRRDGTRVSGAHVRESHVPPSEFYIADRGAPGRGPKVVKRLRKGLMTQKAREYGLLKPGESIGDLTEAEARKLALKMAEDPEIGPQRSWRMFHVQTVFRKRQPDGFKAKMVAGREAVAGKYEEEIMPKEAVAKWKAMSPEERKRAAPERAGRAGYRKKTVWRVHPRTGKRYKSIVWAKA